MCDFRKYHVLSSIVYIMVMLYVLLFTNNPVIIIASVFMDIIIFKLGRGLKKLKHGFLIFIPFCILTMVINMVFSSGGRYVLFVFLGKKYTLEALIYALNLSLKLLSVIFLFMLFGIFLDTDRAVSYFSNKMPKSTLMLMIGFKLVPNMKIRIGNLMSTYAVRGVNFEEKGMLKKIKSYIPVFTVLVFDSLEGAFDIGEAAYVRGFLSAKRSIYDRQKFKLRDIYLIASSIVLFLFYLFIQIKGFDEFDVYSGLKFSIFINLYIVVFVVMALLFLAVTCILSSNQYKCRLRR